MDSESLPPSLQKSLELKEETPIQKFFRRLKQEPLIPLGCTATCYALYRAYRSLKARDSVELNRMFRARIYAQAFTIVAIVVGGMYYRTEREQRREFEKMLEARKSQEKRDAWLRELEVRDKEDQGWRERHAAMEAAAKEAGKSRLSSEPAIARPAPTSTEQDGGSAASAAVEASDEKKVGGVLDAVKSLVSGKK